MIGKPFLPRYNICERSRSMVQASIAKAGKACQGQSLLTYLASSGSDEEKGFVKMDHRMERMGMGSPLFVDVTWYQCNKTFFSSEFISREKFVPNRVF